MVDPLGVSQSCIMHNARVKTFPDGRTEVLCAPRCMFRETGWERADEWGQPQLPPDEGDGDKAVESVNDNAGRARRRARSAVRDLAHANDFDMFVTLTLDAEQVDRYDPSTVAQKMNRWLDNQVRRHGLCYVLVPELHKDGALHFHGLINSEAVQLVDSGTLTDGGKPRRPRGAKDRARLLDAGWHTVYNLPQWTMGFTTGIFLYGDRDAAVSYVCKYVSKQDAKIGGRWYYSGGVLRRPSVLCVDMDYDTFAAEHPGGCWVTDDGKQFCAAVVDKGGNWVESGD